MPTGALVQGHNGMLTACHYVLMFSFEQILRNVT